MNILLVLKWKTLYYKDVIKGYYSVKCFKNSVINISPYLK